MRLKSITYQFENGEELTMTPEQAETIRQLSGEANFEAVLEFMRAIRYGIERLQLR